jgi:acyl-coenzyme A thioesterase PaaI-like protein
MLSFFTRTDANVSDPATLVTKASTLYQRGSGLTGGPSILHGGMTMAMVDEAMGSLTEINAALGKQGAAFGSMSVTGALDIRFLRPIPTGTAVVATAWMEGVEGRKTRVRCEVRDEQGEELARCSSTWVATKAKF